VTIEPAASDRVPTLPGLTGVEHLSITVADLEEAADFFVEFFGCERFYDQGPFGGGRDSFMRTYANVDVRAKVERMSVLRSPYLNVELFQGAYPGQNTIWPSTHDIGGWHLAAYVDDIDAALAWLAEKDVYILGPGRKPTSGIEAGKDSFTVHCMAPFGFRFELLTYPNGRAYEGATQRRLWNPSAPDVPAVPALPHGGLPGFRGFEHLSLTVKDIDEAAQFLEEVFGCTTLYSIGPFSDPDGSEFGASANTDVRAVVREVRLMRSTYLNLELVEASYPGQRIIWPAMLDVGGWHLAFHVEDMDAAMNALRGRGCHLLGPKKPRASFEAGPGGYTLHGLANFGLCFELVTFPHGQRYERHHRNRLWHPGQPLRDQQ
jgi:catechol 2,3-dioxygenase-like lactoylglutathione lyase family enzyme